ncbi:RmlC-like cupin, partial [Linderina pennispora]
MSAASGIIHSEMPTEKMLKEGGVMHSFQIWVNLPAKYKMTAPRYQDVPPENIPTFTSSDEKTQIKVIAGKVEDVTANIDTRTQIFFLDLRTTGQYALDLPSGMDAMVYNFHTEPILVGNEKAEVKEGQMAVIKTDGQPIGFEAAGSEEARVLVLAGTPIGEKVARYGPFVMNTRDELYQAFEDMETGRFGSIPGQMERMQLTDSANAARAKAGKE